MVGYAIEKRSEQWFISEILRRHKPWGSARWAAPAELCLPVQGGDSCSSLMGFHVPVTPHLLWKNTKLLARQWFLSQNRGNWILIIHLAGAGTSAMPRSYLLIGRNRLFSPFEWRFQADFSVLFLQVCFSLHCSELNFSASNYCTLRVASPPIRSHFNHLISTSPTCVSRIFHGVPIVKPE